MRAIMIKLRIKELCEEREATVSVYDPLQQIQVQEPVNNAYRLDRLLGINSSAISGPLWRGVSPKTGEPVQSLHLAHLTKIIKAFGLTADTRLGDLFAGLPGEEKPKKAARKTAAKSEQSRARKGKKGKPQPRKKASAEA